MTIKTTYLVFRTKKPVVEPSSKLRGFIGGRFPDHALLHNHIKEGYIYTYPMIQYKVLGGTASILGIEEGARVIKEISNSIDTLVLGNSVYNIEQRILYEQEVELKPIDHPVHYKFVSPWLALNPENHKKFCGLNHWKDKKEFLNSILVGNILSMCKGLGITVNNELYTSTHLDMEKVKYKATQVIGFTGYFIINFEIPQFFGIGKGVSQGFGVVMNAGGES
ncbi:MAG: CRISPR-associated endonuclease Cas6 [Candidatus Methanoperedens sp.]|nr:CRISPR-associated endonuclease Cas6 [Candidatus Methanoperedens sp.]